MRIFNNTKMDLDMILGLNKHLITTRFKFEEIELITFNMDDFDVFGHDDKFLGTFKYNKNCRVKGTIRWFDKSSGHGVIRIDKSDASVSFYSCNVDGADSLYPQLVSNIEFNSGDKVTAVVSCDSYLFNSIGLIKIKRGA